MFDTVAELGEGWTAFAANLPQQPEYRRLELPAYRQAFKNGVAAVLARGITRGPGALAAYLSVDKLPRIDDVGVLQDILWPMWVQSQHAHPDWHDLHLSALIAGGIAVMTLFFTGKPLAEIGQELECFDCKRRRT
jgi:hypothetical protein